MLEGIQLPCDECVSRSCLERAFGKGIEEVPVKLAETLRFSEGEELGG